MKYLYMIGEGNKYVKFNKGMYFLEEGKLGAVFFNEEKEAKRCKDDLFPNSEVISVKDENIKHYHM